MTIADTALPAVSYCTRTSDYNRRVSKESNLRTLYRVDDDVRSESFQLQWTDAEPETAAAIDLHYEAHGAGTFRWKAPSDSTTSTWRYKTAPTIQHSTARSASISVEVERVLAFRT